MGSIPGSSLFLPPQVSKSFTDKIDVTGDLGQNNTCLISLYNNLGTLLDKKYLNFSTTDMVHQSSTKIYMIDN